jgi:hypothetical protein
LSHQTEANTVFPLLPKDIIIIHIGFICQERKSLGLFVVKDFKIGGRQKYTKFADVESVFIHEGYWMML